MVELFTFENATALLTLTMLEIVLGIDNIVFISILAGKLEKPKQGKARNIGLLLAMVSRILLLFAISWVMGLTRELFIIPVVDHPITGRDLILLFGGGFLMYKATTEIHDKVEGSGKTIHQPESSKKFVSILAQIVAMDVIFSLDSVITAVGMVPQENRARWIPLVVMITAIVISIAVMLAFAGRISSFIEKHPTAKMLALAFLFMIGMVLVADGLGKHIPKGYIYSAMVFSLAVEFLNLRAKKVKKPEPAKT